MTSVTKLSIDILGLQEPDLRVTPSGVDRDRLLGLGRKFGLHTLLTGGLASCGLVSGRYAGLPHLSHV